MRSQLLRNLTHLVFRVVSNSAHPKAKGPKRRNGAATCQSSVFRQNVFRLTQKHKDIQVLVSRIDHIVGVEVFAKIERQRRSRMHKHPITVVTQKKWYRLVHEFALRAHSVSRRHQNALSSLVESREGFSTTKYLLIVLQLKSRRNATCKITRTTHK